MKYRKKLVLKEKWQRKVEGLAFIGIGMLCCIEADSVLPYLFFASFTIPYLLLMKYMKYDD